MFAFYPNSINVVVIYFIGGGTMIYTYYLIKAFEDIRETLSNPKFIKMLKEISEALKGENNG